MDTNLKQAQVLCSEIKRLIRSSGYTYVQIARKMNLSESGLKKILSKSDMPTSRLIQFCEVLNLSLNDLVQLTESQNFIDISFEKQQESAFVNDYRIFLFYWFLVYERRSLDEVKKIMGLDHFKSERFLIKLDKLKLISYLAGGKLKLPSPKPVRWVDDSAFVKNLYKRWGKNLVFDLIHRPQPDKQYFMLRYLQMSEERFKEFVALLTEIDKETLNKSTRQMRLNSGKLKHVRWMTCVDQLSWGEEDLKSVL